MSLAVLNDREVMSLSVSMPLRGAWQVRASINGDRAVTSTAITAPGMALSGTARRSGTFTGRTELVATAGSGGLGIIREAKAYRGVTMRIVVDDILRESAEALAVDASANVLDLILLHWTRQRDRAGFQLTSLVASVGATWRARDNGSIWIGIDSYPAVTMDHVLLSEDKARNRIAIAPVDARLRPGVTFLGRKVVNVTHKFSDKVRTEVEFE